MTYLREIFPRLPVGVIGSSSGGWFALHLCNSMREEPPAFCIPLCPVADPHARAVYLQHCVDSNTSKVYPYRHAPERAREILKSQLQYFDESLDQMEQAARAVQENLHQVPTLLILASHDLNVPPQAVENVQRQWATRTVVIGNGSGHEIQNAPPAGYDSYIPDIDRFLSHVLRKGTEYDMT